jgi:Uma2 family endonuclease
MKMSIEDYFELDKSSLEIRYEFIDGSVYMLAGGTADHSTINGNLVSALKNALRGGPCRVHTSDLKVRLSETRYVFPDISVSCDPRDRGRITVMQTPILIVETLSPSTEAYNRRKKFSYYRACPSIQEYILVDTQEQIVEVYRRDKEPFWKYSAFETGEQVELTSLGISIPVATIYEDVELPEVPDL